MSGPDKGLEIIVVGAGLAGLLAAWRLARDGHKIRLLERQVELSPRGTGIALQPNATQHLVQWGLEQDIVAVGESDVERTEKDLKSGQTLRHVVPQSQSKYPTWVVLRKTLQNLLLRKLESENLVTISLGTSVQSVSDSVDSASRPAVVLSDGTVVEADLIIAADGIRSRVRSIILADCNVNQPPIQPILTPMANFQTILPYDDVVNSPEIAALAKGGAGMTVWVGEGHFALTACGPKMNICVGAFVLSEGKSDTVSGERLWDEFGDLAFVRKGFADSHPLIKALLDKVEFCHRWKIAALPPLPRWTSTKGRIILLGDSAHAMLPSGAQGFSQTVEDVAVLSYLLNKIKMKSGPEVARLIEIATRTWQQCRKPLVERVQLYSSARRSALSSEMGKGSEEEFEPGVDVAHGKDADVLSDEFRHWLLNHDALENVDQVWDQEVAAGRRLELGSN